MPVSPEEMARAQAAGWDPADGDPPHVHGEFVDGLATSEHLEDLLDDEAQQ